MMDLAIPDNVRLLGGVCFSDRPDVRHAMRRFAAIRARSGTEERHRARFLAAAA